MNEPITSRITTGPPVLFDGAIGSRLIQMGLPAGKAPEAWLLPHPERIRQVQEGYVNAGAEVITTCSFGANRLRLRKGSLEDQTDKINQAAVQVTKEAAQNRAYIAGGMGPTGEFFQPQGLLTEKEAKEVFEEQAKLLAEAGIDLFLLETHYDLREALICLDACQRVAPQIPVGVTLTFNNTPRGFFTVMGDPAVEALRELSAKGAFLVGSNCTLEAKGMLELAQKICPEVKSPLLFQPNAGTPQITPDGVIYPQQPAEFTKCAEEILRSGALAIGGCCGTETEHFQSLRTMIDANFKGN